MGWGVGAGCGGVCHCHPIFHKDKARQGVNLHIKKKNIPPIFNNSSIIKECNRTYVIHRLTKAYWTNVRWVYPLLIHMHKRKQNECKWVYPFAIHMHKVVYPFADTHLHIIIYYNIYVTYCNIYSTFKLILQSYSALNQCRCEPYTRALSLWKAVRPYGAPTALWPA